jgi:hypothetical protein
MPAINETQPITADGTGTVPDALPEVCLIDDVESQPAEWLWPARVAVGQLTLAMGEPGAGKSLLLMDLVSRVSRGAEFPGCDESTHESASADVLLITRQSLAEVVKPRLLAAGADPMRVRVMCDVPCTQEGEPCARPADDATPARLDPGAPGWHAADGKPCTQPFDAATDLAHLENWLAGQSGCKLVVIDPLALWLDKRGRGYAGDCHAMLRELGKPGGHSLARGLPRQGDGRSRLRPCWRR